ASRPDVRWRHTLAPLGSPPMRRRSFPPRSRFRSLVAPRRPSCISPKRGIAGVALYVGAGSVVARGESLCRERHPAPTDYERALACAVTPLELAAALGC